MATRFSIATHSNLNEGHYHSMLISYFRGFAAVEVAAAHLRARTFPGFNQIADPNIWYKTLAFTTGFAHQAVVIFFLLSGWLVGGSLLNKFGTPNALKSYAIDRITRLWIVLVPTFLLIMFFAATAGVMDTSQANFSSAHKYSMTSFLGNLVGVQTLVVPTFGGNFPLWSLANETWYYVLFPLLVVILSDRSAMRKAAAGFAVLVIGYFLTESILLYFALWLMGAYFSRLKIDTGAVGRWALFLLFFMVAVYFRMTGKNDDMGREAFLQDFAYSILFLMSLSSMQFKIKTSSYPMGWFNKVGKFFADFSFTLYVVHIPLIGMLVHFIHPLCLGGRFAQSVPAHWVAYGGMLAFIVLAAYLFHLPFEAQTSGVGGCIKRQLLGGPGGVEKVKPLGAADR
jgi:peptidoglycan/LPS O-acetylase OafA/YrhL